MPDTPLTFWITSVALLASTWVDLRERRIPNYVVGPYLLAGFAARGAAGADALLAGLAGLAIAGLVAGGLHVLTGLGMGDVKLLSAFGWWVGPSQLRYALPAVALAGGILALGFLAIKSLRKRTARGDVRQDARNANATAAADACAPLTMPYAPAIAIGAMFSFFAH